MILFNKLLKVMGSCAYCFNHEIFTPKLEYLLEADIEEHYLIQPSLLPSEIGIQRKALKKPNLQEQYTITSIYKKASHELRLLQHEAALLKSLSHPNIIALENTFEDDIVYHMVTEEVTGVSLLDLIIANHHLTELAVKSIIKQILKALKYLHQREICYGNLSMETIKITNSQVKLVNFTKARNIHESTLMIGNYNFMPPECFAERCNEKFDMWSVGVIAYYLLTGALPFEGSEKVDIVAKISKGRYQTAGLSDQSKEFIAKLLVVDPENRMSAEDALGSPWLAKILDLN